VERRASAKGWARWRIRSRMLLTRALLSTRACLWALRACVRAGDGRRCTVHRRACGVAPALVGVKGKYLQAFVCFLLSLTQVLGGYVNAVVALPWCGVRCVLFGGRFD
jgi:hypothetical protein